MLLFFCRFYCPTQAQLFRRHGQPQRPEELADPDCGSVNIDTICNLSGPDLWPDADMPAVLEAIKSLK